MTDMIKIRWIKGGKWIRGACALAGIVLLCGCYGEVDDSSTSPEEEMSQIGDVEKVENSSKEPVEIAIERKVTEDQDKTFIEAMDRLNQASVLPEDFYTNELVVEDSWEKYGIGDPFVFRWNGMYYLYPSTKDFNVGIRVWTSKDMVNWEYGQEVAGEELTEGAYAPEVTYYNGTFYMCTSPAGQGHYVLTSDSPLGPFKAVTDNFGHLIDGSFFIDDDSRFYFYNSGDKGIQGIETPDLMDITGAKVLNAYMNWWTEGPMVIKREGIYYLTYTGNHLDSTGYRINYSTSTEGPLGPYEVGNNNPIAINTEGNITGIGHNSTVMGPDLDSYYMMYHSSDYSTGPRIRSLNMDRFLFNGRRLTVSGPSEYSQPVPERPVFEVYGLDQAPAGESLLEEAEADGVKAVLSNQISHEAYTAEYNVMSGKQDKAVSLIFSYIDDQNYGQIFLDYQGETFSLLQYKDGQVTRKAFDLFDGYNKEVLHTFRLQVAGDSVDVYIDQMLKGQVTDMSFGGGKIGYSWQENQPDIGYTAFSDKVHGSSDYTAYKGVPGILEAVHYLPGQGTGYQTGYHEEAGLFRKSDAVKISKDESGIYSVNLEHAGDWLSYHVNVEKPGLHTVTLLGQVPSQATGFEVYMDGNLVGNIGVGGESTYDKGKFIGGNIDLEAGCHTLTFRKVTEGTMVVSAFELEPVTTEFLFENPLNDGVVSAKEASYIGGRGKWGIWDSKKDGYVPDKDVKDVKVLFGPESLQDYSVDFDLMIKDGDSIGSAGLLIRSSEESYFEHQIDAAAIAYYVSFDRLQVTLTKLNYGREHIAGAKIKIEDDKSYHVRVEAEGSTIRVYWDGGQEAILEYTDPEAYITGRTGFWSKDSKMYFKNLKIESF